MIERKKLRIKQIYAQLGFELRIHKCYVPFFKCVIVNKNMKRFLIIIVAIGFLFTNCRNKTNPDKFEVHQVLPSGKKFFVMDSSQYSSEFIQELRTLDSQYDSLKLIDKNLIININEKILIPTDLPLARHVVYYSKKGDEKYSLDLKLINYTSIDYELKINDRIEKAGQASMRAGFLFFGSETSSEENGEVYSLTQYFDNKDCLNYIGVEFGNGNRVEFEVYCEKDSAKNIMNLPTFKKK